MITIAHLLFNKDKTSLNFFSFNYYNYYIKYYHFI